MVAGRRVVVIGNDALAAALAARGAEVIGEVDGGVVDGLVVDVVETTPPQALADMTDDEFAARWEGPMGRAIDALQAAYPGLRRSGDGRVVVVVPAVALTGAPGHGAGAAAAEGLRALAKSAARQWGPDGITVNCVAVGGDPAAAPAGLSAPALGRPVDAAATVAFLAGADSRDVTGTTVVVDGGAVMAP